MHLAVSGSECAKSRNGLATLFQHGANFIGLIGRDNHHHARATIKGAQHLRLFDAALASQPVKNREGRKSSKVDIGANFWAAHAADFLSVHRL